MTTNHKTKWREARMRLKNRDVMTIFNRDGTTTEVEHPFSALQALHYEQQIDIDKIKKALLIAYIGNVGCTLSNEDCNDLTKYISRLEGNIAAYENSLAAALAEAKENFNLCMEQYDIQQERACNAEDKLAEANKDAERLADKYLDEYDNCFHCGGGLASTHEPNCPITLHRDRLARKVVKGG